MKKIVTLLLAAILAISSCFILGACNDPSEPEPENSGVTLDSFSTKMKEIDDDLALVKNGNQHTFTYDGIAKAEYAVACDAEDYVTSVSVKCMSIDMTKVETANGILTICGKSAGSMTMGDLKIATCYLRLVKLIEVVYAESSSLSATEVAEMIAEASSATYGDWKVSVTKSSDSITLAAEYLK